MLLNKKLKLILVSSIFLIILPIVYPQQTCTAAEIKDALRKALFEYFENPTNSKLSVNEIKDFLRFYISLDTSQLVVDCGGSGPLSGKPYYLMLGAARNIERGIPRCGDGTEYGKCSSNLPNFCYGGRLEERCKLCGCGQNAVCDVKINKCVPSEAPIEPIPPAQTLPNPPQITIISPSSGMPDTKITLTGTGFTATGNSINWGNQLNAIRELPSPDGKTLTFSALQMQCPQKSCSVSVTNANGISNSVTFNLTHRPAKKTHRGPPQVKVLTPNGGERVVYGKDKINISWSGGIESVALYVSYGYWYPYSSWYTGNYADEKGEFIYSIDWYPIAKGLQPSGSFEWDGKVCNWLNPNDCKQSYPGFLKIVAISQDRKNEPLTSETVFDPEHDNWDESDNSFLQVSPATISSLKVNSPNGEEKWIQDKIVKISDSTTSTGYYYISTEPGTIAPFIWETADFAANSNLYEQLYSVNLLKGGQHYLPLYSGLIYQFWNKNYFDWNLPSYIANGNDYTVEVIFHGPNGDVKDVSDKPFTIGTVPGVIAVRGKLLDRFTNAPSQLPDGYHFWGGQIYSGTRSDGTNLSPIRASFWTGNFAFGMTTDDSSIATQRAYYNRQEAVSMLPIWVSKKPDNTYEVLADVIDQNPQPLRADVVNSEANLGKVTAWTSATLGISTDVPITYSIEYEQDGLSKKGSVTPPTQAYSYPAYYYQEYYRGSLIPLKYNTRVKLVDNAGNVYYSPYINLGLEYTRYGATLIFKNGTVKWNIPPNIHVVYPNGSEWLKMGNTETIKWECVNLPAGYICNPKVDVYFTGSYNDQYSSYYDAWGTGFYPLNKIATVTGTTYNWTIPQNVYGWRKILVSSWNQYNSGIYGRDYSDGWFYIS